MELKQNINVVYPSNFDRTQTPDDPNCVHLKPSARGETSINFDIHLGKCGMSSSSDSAAGSATNNQQQALQSAGSSQQQQQPNGLYIENTIVIQYDPQVQEIYDQARRLRCTWYDYYEKSVTFRPYNVDMLDAVTANFLGDNIQCWMQIQVGRGPWASEVAGIVKIGQTMTMVLAIKDDENKFDMLVRNCVASDGKHQPIQLVDEYGCVARPKIMAKFQKVRNFGPAATVVSYAHFQAFKFPDSMSVNFQCVIQVCRYECPEPVCSSTSGALGDHNGPGALAAPPAPPTASGQDYAASGTELVSSKELLPVAGSASRGHLNASQQSSVNLKLDESQGRVQVRLDTSMLANSGHNGLRPAGGALPPHLLAGAAEQATSGGRAASSPHLSSSYYRPSLGGAGAPSRPAPPSSGQVRASQLAALPGGGQHYSSPATSSSLLQQHHHPRPAYMMTNRMGELVAEDGLGGPVPSNEDELASKLSLIASPRALTYAQPTSANHRYRRSINGSSSSGDAGPKMRRQAGPTAAVDSTAIKTQRTIQVVSPDDVAFNLIDSDSGLPEQWPAGAGWSRRSKGGHLLAADSDSTMVCVSAGRLVATALASSALLVMLLLAAAWIILRQRKRLDQKLSPLYDSTIAASGSLSSSSAALASPDLMISNDQSAMSHHTQQQQQQQQHHHHHHQRQRAAVAAAAEEIILRRQREEIQQRNTYLGRLYSQFVPAAYWR